MTFLWLSLSTVWELSSVQAAVNVILSVLGAIGIWSFSRYWWQRGCTSVLRGESDVPLSALFTISSPGEGWDTVVLLRRKVWERDNRHLLLQVVVVLIATVATALAGPIAKVSLRSVNTVQPRRVEILHAVRNDYSYSTNLLNADVLWNDTSYSLEKAKFPTDQLLDYLPPSTIPWTYVAKEWDPTWRLNCEFVEETHLPNLVADSNFSFSDPLNAFPAYGATFNVSWTNKSEMRYESIFGWNGNYTRDIPMKNMFIFTVLQSEPTVRDRMHGTNESLKLLISTLHLRDFKVADPKLLSKGQEDRWRPAGTIGNASYTKVECNVVRRSVVPNEWNIAWPWTNDTNSLVRAYLSSTYYGLEKNSTSDRPVLMPTPKQMIRLYQSYMISVAVQFSKSTEQRLSVWVPTVQLSGIFLMFLIFFVVLIFGVAVRYCIFIRKKGEDIEKIYVPDGKIEWMIHAAKVSAVEEDEQSDQPKAEPPSRDYFNKSTFGQIQEDLKTPRDAPGPRDRSPHCGLARVKTLKSSSFTSLPEESPRRSRRFGRRKSQTPRAYSPSSVSGNESFDIELTPVNSQAASCSGPTLAIPSSGEGSHRSTRDSSPHPDDGMLHPPPIIRVSLSEADSYPSALYPPSPALLGSSASSFQSIVPDYDDGDVSPIEEEPDAEIST